MNPLIIIKIISLFIIFYIFIKKYNITNKYNFSKIKEIIYYALLTIILYFIINNAENVLAIVLHYYLFYFLIRIIIISIEKISKKTFKKIYLKIITIVITVIYFLIGFFNYNNIIRQEYNIKSKKIKDNFKIALLADIHADNRLNDKKIKALINRINKENVDLVVIAGDLVDDSSDKNNLNKICKQIKLLKSKYGTYFIFGNHDNGKFNFCDFDINYLKKLLIKNNISILEDNYKIINDICIIGRKDKSNKDRKNIKDILYKINKNKYIIDLNHQPNDFKKEVNNVDLVLSGHTHGGQFIPLSLIFNIFKINDLNYGLKKIKNTSFIVTSGISDWKFLFKTGIKSEYVIININ